MTKTVSVEEHGCEQLAQSRYAGARWQGIELATSSSFKSDALPRRHHATLPIHRASTSVVITRWQHQNCTRTTARLNAIINSNFVPTGSLGQQASAVPQTASRSVQSLLPYSSVCQAHVGLQTHRDHGTCDVRSNRLRHSSTPDLKPNFSQLTNPLVILPLFHHPLSGLTVQTLYVTASSA